MSLYSHHVPHLPNQQESGPKDYFKKQNFLQGWISKIYFTRDQNPNSPYLQGPKAYFSQRKKTKKMKNFSH